jgi:PadR family transcriptional regulator, regulatory protein AphA
MLELPDLNPTSYVVMGLLSAFGPATPYQLKQRVGFTVGYFWSFSHSQIYGETARLAAAGLLDVRTESTGRRRRVFSLTGRGQAAVLEWLLTGTLDTTEVRDPGLLKLFFWDLAPPDRIHDLARDQELAHRRQADHYAQLRQQVKDAASPYQLRSLDLGERMERLMVDFWREIQDLPPIPR